MITERDFDLHANQKPQPTAYREGPWRWRAAVDEIVDGSLKTHWRSEGTFPDMVSARAAAVAAYAALAA